MYYLCQFGQLVPLAQLVRYVPMNRCQLGQLVPSAQLARDVLFMPIGPIGSTGPISAICHDELMPIGPIGTVSPISAICRTDANWANCFHGPYCQICTMYANWANWFHGPNWCDMSQCINANCANWFHRPNWRDMYYLCLLGQLVPRAQLQRLVPMN